MNNQSKKPIEELLRGIPQDHRICVPFQWAEDGRETGHHYIPVGRHVHQAADEITALREQLKECSAAFDRQQQQLDRNAEQNAALRLDASSKWAFLEWRDRAEKAEAALAKEEGK